MLTLKSIGAWAEGSGKKPREPDTESVYSMQQQNEWLQKVLLHTDSIGECLVTAYVKKFTCSRERVTERKDTGLTPRTKLHSRRKQGSSEEESGFGNLDFQENN